MAINSFEEILAIIDDIKKIHSELKDSIDFNVEDNKHAIYILQGGSITALNYSYKFNLSGCILPLLQQYRMIIEIVDLILFFDEISKDARQIKAFFKNKTVGRKPGNTGNLSYEERAKNDLLAISEVKHMDGVRKELVNLSSKFMHPTLDAIRSNLSQKTYLFDYDNLLAKKPYFDIRSFSNLFLIPVLHGLLLPINNFVLLKDNYEKLNKFLKMIRDST